MNVLGFDTSTAATAACVLRSDGESFERVPAPEDLHRAPAHARELLPAIHRVMRESGLGWAGLDLVGVCVGPGSFTGVRVGVTTARSLAQAQGLPLRGVSSLAALAAGSGATRSLPVLDARRGEVFAALFAGGSELWPPSVMAPDELARRCEQLPEAPVGVGDGSLRFRSMLEAAGVRVAPEDSPLHVVRAVQVCRLAARADGPSGEEIVPLYLRDPDARPAR